MYKQYRMIPLCFREEQKKRLFSTTTTTKKKNLFQAVRTVTRPARCRAKNELQENIIIII